MWSTFACYISTNTFCEKIATFAHYSSRGRISEGLFIVRIDHAYPALTLYTKYLVKSRENYSKRSCAVFYGCTSWLCFFDHGTRRVHAMTRVSFVRRTNRIAHQG